MCSKQEDFWLASHGPGGDALSVGPLKTTLNSLMLSFTRSTFQSDIISFMTSISRRLPGDAPALMLVRNQSSTDLARTAHLRSSVGYREAANPLRNLRVRCHLHEPWHASPRC